MLTVALGHRKTNTLYYRHCAAQYIVGKFKKLPLTSLSVAALSMSPKKEGSLVKSVLSEWVVVLMRIDDGLLESSSLFWNNEV